MRVLLVLDGARLWRWQLTLIEQLTAVPGIGVTVGFAADRVPIEPALVLALMLEEAISQRGANPVDRLTPVAVQPWLEDRPASPELVIDLAASTLETARSQRTLIPLFDGAPGERAFWSAVLDGAAPQLSIADTQGDPILIGLPALQSPHALRVSAGAVLTRLITGLVRAIHSPESAPVMAAPAGPPAPLAGLARPAARLIGRKIAIKAQRLIERTLATAPQWAVAWRTLPAGHNALATGDLDPASFILLPDDGRRYFADPFLFARGDETDIFVEELPYATGRGIISMLTLRADGSVTQARPVLEAPHHLSYPQMFARDGAIFMLPEASASGCLTLYRAVRYPDQWEPVERLIDEPVHDATLFEHDGRLWIAANAEGPPSARWGSSWDALSLYSAQSLLGPWTAHTANPVLIDARATRPAGCVFPVGDKLYRPVQDCSAGYGTKLGLVEITGLDDTGYTQTLVAGMAFPQSSGLLGPHTLNRTARGGGIFEVIDLFGSTQRLALTRPENAGRAKFR